jgi:feruloyl esterase
MPEWMWNEEAWTNLIHAGLKKTHDASQEVLKAMYGTDSRITYFGGQSHGGREALFVANMYPDDYEGVISAGPLAYWAGWVIGEGFRVKDQIAPGAWVPPSKGVAIREETLRLCDALDGVADGAIQNYVACNRKLDPTITPNPLAKIRCPSGKDEGDHCLSDTQMATVNAWHAPTKYPYAFANGETDFPGLPTGGEGPQGWLLAQREPTATSTAGRPNFLSGGLRDKNLTNGIKVDPVVHRDKIQNMSKLMDARPDWSKLLARGSKIIYYTPGSDYLISSRAQFRVYEEALKKSGQAAFERGVRYYVGPGLGHGGSGNDAKGRPLPQFADLVGVMQNWVENGVMPPDPIVQTVMEPNPPFKVTRSRPLCRYPAYPHYSGSGDPDVAASYTCRTTEGATSSK